LDNAEPAACQRSALLIIRAEKIVKRLKMLLVAAILAGASMGCGGLSEKDKGKNSGLDRPRPTVAEK
jgi:hypothetical protein